MDLTKEQRKAVLTIKNYLNVNGNSKYTDDFMMVEFELAIDELIENATEIKTIKTTGIKSKSEGTQSVTFESNIEAWSVNDSVKMLLPLPFVRMLG